MLHIFNIIKNNLNKKYKGIIAIEWILLFPIMFISFVFCIYFFMMGLSYVSYNNLAGNIAQDLNMRKLGYEDKQIPQKPIIYNNDGTVNTDVKINIPQETLRNAIYYLLEENQNRLAMPYSKITEINAYVFRGGQEITDFKSMSMSGSTIEIHIKYNFKFFSFMVPLKGIGHNTIS